MTLTLPLLPLRDIVVFPSMVVPLFVGRDKSVAALERAMAGDKSIFLVSQIDPAVDDPGAADLYPVGVVASVLQMLKLPDGTVRVLIEGAERASLVSLDDDGAVINAQVATLDDVTGESDDLSALVRSTVAQFGDYAKLNKRLPPETLAQIEQIDRAGPLADAIAANLNIRVSEKQTLLEQRDVVKRIERLLELMADELGALQVDKRVRGRVKRQMEKTQREYYLNEQMKAIKRELGGEGPDGDGEDELAELMTRIDKAKMPKEVRTRALSEYKKLSGMAPMSAESTVVRNYLDALLGVPWGKASKLNRNIADAQTILDEDHFGLEKVKERIVEYLAVQARTNKLKGPILCLVGPPGVGKTSLGRSIARATGRKFVRQSLGGVRDEAEIRGHRRTYIGSMPGKIVANLKRAETMNPLFLLDEIDKLGQDYRGDPASALLEVLDPEQNGKFQDHYLELDMDLSNVMFVTTANSLNLPQALLDRMEIIRLEGYTEVEKIEIAKRHLLPKQIEAHGLKAGEFALDDAALRDLIRYYTREAGVRTLEREIARLARKVLRRILEGKATSITVTPDNLGAFAGVQKYRFGVGEAEDQIGAVTGLAWTEVGGELLTIEAVTVPGKGQVRTTGKLGDVMTESIQAAMSFVKSRAPSFGIKPSLFQRKDIHIHLPEGAVPKDGPSAGVGMVTAMVSTLTGIAVRRDVAMTGEVTLRGRVLPIGGLKEKLLAAQRGNITTVLIPGDNEKDLAEIPEAVKDALTIVPVWHVDDVLRIALTKGVTPIEWSEADDLASIAPPSAGDGGVPVRH
ncbi:MAG: endopeptidase La [Sphingopyxis sp.]